MMKSEKKLKIGVEKWKGFPIYSLTPTHEYDITP